MKAQKAKGNSSFRSHAEYVSHVDAYARTTGGDESQNDISMVGMNRSSSCLGIDIDQKRKKYAKLLAHKRLYDPVYLGGKAPKPVRQTR